MTDRELYAIAFVAGSLLTAFSTHWICMFVERAFARRIARWLHIANTWPEWIGRDRFYAMKHRILHRFGEPDGYDVQHLKGQQCWTCGGSGIYVDYHTYSGGEREDICGRCGGDGWWKRPVWVALARYRLGGYTFHLPESRTYEPPVPDVTRIVGYVEHKSYDYRHVQRAGLLLGLLFDWSIVRDELAERWRRARVAITKRCSHCGRHTWARMPLCRRCEASEEIPF